MPKLSVDQLTRALEQLPEWKNSSDTIWRIYQFPDFVKAVAFVNRVADIAEAANHHPDIDIRYNKVTIGLSTHDEGGITEKDSDEAGKIEAASKQSG
jgi:4a-hydroxytetrahydrobiopterin dehydratase